LLLCSPDHFGSQFSVLSPTLSSFEAVRISSAAQTPCCSTDHLFLLLSSGSCRLAAAPCSQSAAQAHTRIRTRALAHTLAKCVRLWEHCPIIDAAALRCWQTGEKSARPNCRQYTLFLSLFKSERVLFFSPCTITRVVSRPHESVWSVHANHPEICEDLNLGLVG
jgi:hypothetical protein